MNTRTTTRPILSALRVFLLILVFPACQHAIQVANVDAVHVPFLKNSPNECYYLDEFMPAPDGLVSGKSGSLDLRYYTYKTANYKEWRLKGIMLSFYSKNGRCWSLFEEYYVTE